jgi:NAD-dependent SIR2 family protein deacetylase
MPSRMKSGALKIFIEGHQRVFVLTGASCSTNSGIFGYRDGNGNWSHSQSARSPRPMPASPPQNVDRLHQAAGSRDVINLARTALTLSAAGHAP